MAKEINVIKLYVGAKVRYLGYDAFEGLGELVVGDVYEIAGFDIYGDAYITPKYDKSSGYRHFICDETENLKCFEIVDE